jgi:hypothetical protein
LIVARGVSDRMMHREVHLRTMTARELIAVLILGGDLKELGKRLEEGPEEKLESQLEQ